VKVAESWDGEDDRMEARALRLVVGIACLALVRSTAMAEAPTGASRSAPQLEAMRGDAQLTDVFFVDARHGWTVGDRGAIWHTGDGGRHWTPQESGVDGRLSSVFFLDAQTGWAAGGAIEPYTRTSVGIVLRTRDGGQSWLSDRKLSLPAVQRMRFFDARRGWAIGQASAYFPSGVFRSDDGGRSWSGVPSSESRGWLSGDFVDPDTGAMAGRTSALAEVRRRAVEPREADFGLRALRQLRLVAPAGGWLVGDGGLVLTTRDLGHSWQTPEGDPGVAVRDNFDFAALALQGQHCWIAGTPGSRVLHSADAGKTWSAQPTGQTLPINALHFVDERTGWAVGELGTILATSDGGNSWQKQRIGGARCAYVGFFGRGSDIPLELIARLSADEGYLAAIEVLNREDVESRDVTTADGVAQTHEAVVRAGGSASGAAWRFPLRQASLRLSADQLVELWNQANDTTALEKLEAHIVSRVRMWRPSVVFTSAADTRGDDPLAHVVNQIVLRAVERAADPQRYPDQISDAGLPAWKVQKVYGALPAGQSGVSNVSPAQVATRLGRSIGELAAPARGVLGGTATAQSVNRGFRLLVDHIPQDVGQRDFFSGIALAPGGEARRRLDEAPERDLEAMRREVQARRNLQAIVAQAEGGDGTDERYLAGIGEQTRKMAPDRAAEVLLFLADRYCRQGRWELAADCHDQIVERCGDQPLAASSLVWLIQYYASGEAAWRNRAAQQINVRQASAQTPVLDAPSGDVRQAAVSAPLHVQSGAGLASEMRASGGRLEKAAGYAKQLETLRPALFGEPMARFPLAAAQRALGLPRQAEKYWTTLRHSRPHDAWWTCAQGELWLLDGKGQSPKELWACVRAEGKPRLDGRLDEPFWRSSASVTLSSPQHDDAEWGAVAMLAYDDEFLYLGLSCTKAPGCRYTSSDEPRTRDADLAEQDRVELLVDLDRDYTTYYRLVIDHRGWTGESCWQDKMWNPNWFVAHSGDPNRWTAEAAIPLAEVTGDRPVPRRCWAVGVQRIVPGVGFQSWTRPAMAEPMGEGFGYLIFQ
jgi:photosystem II stability/assembly factor-like uncharacterized protein